MSVTCLNGVIWRCAFVHWTHVNKQTYTRHVQLCKVCSVPLPKSRDGMQPEYPEHWSLLRHFRQVLLCHSYHQSSDVSPVKTFYL